MATNNQNSDGTLSSDNRPFIQPNIGKLRHHLPNFEHHAKQSLLEVKILTSTDNDQYIKLRSPNVAGLPYSAKFRYGSAHWQLHGAQCLATIGSTYVAQVTVALSTDMNNASDFEKAKELLLQLVTTVKVLVDQLLLQTTSLASSIQLELTDLGSNSGQLCEEEILTEKLSNRFVHGKRLTVAIVTYFTMRDSLKDRNVFLKEDKRSTALDKEKRLLEDFLEKEVAEHKNLLLEMCSSQMKPELEAIDSYRCLLIRKDHVTFVRNMERDIKGEVLEEVLPIIWNNFIHRIATVDCNQTLPEINSIFCCVFKSLMEMANQVEAKLSIQNAIEYDGNQWKIASGVIDAAKSGLDRCLVHQVDMLVNFANHYEPGKPSVNENYPYECQIEYFKDYSFSKNDERVWAYLMDAVMVNTFQQDFKQIDEFSEMFKAFLQFISSTGQQNASPESKRMVTHIVLEFAAVFEQLGHGQHQIGKRILKKQLTNVSQAIRESQHDNTRLGQVLNVFKDFWIWSKNGFPKLMNSLNGTYLSPHRNELRTKFIQIVIYALDKNVSFDEITKFFNTFKELFVEIEALGLEWFVRVYNEKIRQTLLSKNAVECAFNRLSRTDDNCFLVVKGKYDLFVKICAEEVVPRHYQAEILNTLLGYITIILEKPSWNGGTCLTGKDQLTGAESLINAIRTSFLYLNEQPEFANFTHYFERSTKPFKKIIKECGSITMFTKRIKYMMNSFEYIWNQEVVSIEKALSIHLTWWQLYVGQFENHMRACDGLQYTDKIKRIVRQVTDSVNPIHVSQWTAEHKQDVLPLTLAGVRAVWSILTSEDVLSSGKFVKPHLLQILTVLRYLCVDNQNTGVEDHLARITTDQGKSVVLGLAAAVLALFGHKVDIVYHNEHLAKHDAANFYELYELFSIQLKISHKTIDDAVNDRMSTISTKAWLHMSKSLGIPPDMSSNIVHEDVDLTLFF